MSNATKCDRCGGYFEQGGKNVRQGWGNNSDEYDLCPDCAESFDAWLERGQMADTSERATESPEMAHDTREKLEAVAQTAAGYIYGRGFTNGLADAWNDDEVDTAANQIIQMLDRQAAITEREFFETACHGCERLGGDGRPTLDELRDELRKYIVKADRLGAALDERDDQLADARESLEAAWDDNAELKAKLDAEAQHAREAWQLWGEADAERDELAQRIQTLEREIATLKEHRAANMEKLHELTDECAELRKYRDEWRGLAEKYRADSIAAQAETERYRAKLGDVLDALHEAERAAR